MGPVPCQGLCAPYLTLSSNLPLMKEEPHFTAGEAKAQRGKVTSVKGIQQLEGGAGIGRQIYLSPITTYKPLL